MSEAMESRGMSERGMSEQSMSEQSMSEQSMSEQGVSEPGEEQAERAWWQSTGETKQCCLILNDASHGYMRLCQEGTGLHSYTSNLSRFAFMEQYRRAYPQAKEGLGAGTWIKTVRDAGNEDADRWIGVGVWGKVFKSFGLDLRRSDVVWKPTNHSTVPCFDGLDKEEVTARGLSARRTVRIVNTFITNWDFLRRSFTQALHRGADIQILLLDYQSPQVKYRADGLGISQEKMQREIHKNLDTLTEFYREAAKDGLAPTRFEVRLYDSAPVVSIYWFDDVGYFGLHWMQQSSIESPQLRVDKTKNAVLFSSMERHFDALWAGASGRRVLPE